MGRTRCRYLQANAIGEKQQLFDARSFSTIYTFSSRSLSMRRHLSFDCGLAIGRRARDIYMQLEYLLSMATLAHNLTELILRGYFMLLYIMLMLTNL